MILHLLTDDKFADYVITQFSAPEMESEFVLVPSNDMMKLVKRINECKIVCQSSKEYAELLKRLDQYSAIFFHGMFWGYWQQPILERVPKSVKVVWYIWGGEIYARHDLGHSFLAPITKMCALQHQLKKLQLKQSPYSWEIPLKLYDKVDYCLTSIYEEYEFAKQYTGASFEHIWYTYYSMEDTVGALMKEQCHGNNIWIGNSAATENNHLDILWAIYKRRKRLNLKERDVIIPLSYGAQWIRKLVKKAGRYMLGNRMKALDAFIPRDEYNELMLSCSTMLIGYWEPAAQGNILTALWLGMRVYLSEKSMSYKFFKRLGAKVFSLESDLDKYQFSELSQDDRKHNREIIAKWYSREHVYQSVRDVVSLLESKKNE